MGSSCERDGSAVRGVIEATRAGVAGVLDRRTGARDYGLMAQKMLTESGGGGGYGASATAARTAGLWRSWPKNAEAGVSGARARRARTAMLREGP